MATLTPERWLEVSPFLDYALSLSEEDRAAWLQTFRAEKPEVFELLESLLQSHRAVAEQGFLEKGPPLPTDSSAAGQKVGPYTLLSPLGHGGMGAVWLAERNDGRFERQVAVKFLRFSLADSAGLERFKREGRILGQLSHPNIAELIDAGVTNKGEPYLVIEHVKGEPIDACCDRKRLDVEARLRLFLNVTAAVAHAHASLIVHRDLKPSNVLVRDDGEVKLLDFGIAKLLQHEDSSADATALTLQGGSALTPQFAAPEQVTGSPVTTATDVYGLGNLLYLMLTGSHTVPATTKSPAELVKAILETEAVAASQAVLSSPDSQAISENRSTAVDRLARQLRGDLDTIVSKSLKKNPWERYNSVTAFADDLQRYLANEPIGARPDSVAYRARKFVARNKLGLTLGSVAMVAAIVAITAVQREAHRAEYRFQQVQRLAHTVLFDLNPQIEDLAGSTPARELLVKTSLEYLDTLAAESGNDAKLQIELATAYEKIGDVQGNSRSSNLGHPEAAVESYRKAIAIAGKLKPSAEALEALVGAYTGIGTVQATQLGDRIKGRENLRTATQIADSVPAFTTKPNYQLWVEAYGMLGDIDELDNPSRAAAPIQRALEISKDWALKDAGIEPRVYTAILTKDWADIRWGMGDLISARARMLDSLSIFAAVLGQVPDNAEWRTQESIDWERMGLLSGHPDFFNLEDRKTAAEWIRKHTAQCERNVSADPKDVRARFDLSESLGELAAVYRDSDPGRSEKLYKRSLALSTSALATDPQDSEMLYWQAFERIGFAALLTKARQNSRSQEQLGHAISVLESLSRRDPAEISAHQLLGVAQQRRAAQLMRIGNFIGAEQDLNRSEDVLTNLLKDNATNLTILRDLANCHRSRGDLAARQSKWLEAQREYQKSFDLWQRWPQIGTSSVYDQRQREVATKVLRQASRKVARLEPTQH